MTAKKLVKAHNVLINLVNTQTALTDVLPDNSFRSDAIDAISDAHEAALLSIVAGEDGPPDPWFNEVMNCAQAATNDSWLEPALAEPTPAKPTVYELAAKTADEIEQRGWCKSELVWRWNDGTYKTGSVCALGGMGAVYYGDPVRGDHPDGNGYDTFVDWVGEQMSTRGYSIVGRSYQSRMARVFHVNDEVWQTKQEAVDFFRAISQKPDDKPTTALQSNFCDCIDINEVVNCD